MLRAVTIRVIKKHLILWDIVALKIWLSVMLLEAIIKPV